MSEEYSAGLDTGHGVNTYPPDKGVPSMPEFEFNNAVAKIAKPLMEKHGIRVVMAQPFDANDVPLRNRTNLYNREKVDIVMSIHADASSNPAANGFWSFHWHTSNDGRRLAEAWTNELNKQNNIRFRSMQESRRGSWTNFHILRETNMPAVLMEHGFMTNSSDLKHLRSDEYRQFAGEAMAKAACRYFGIEYNSGDKVKPDPETPSQLFRVRSSWGNAESQAGAFNVLANAKKLADEKDMNVYNERGRVVYKGSSSKSKPISAPSPSKPSQSSSQNSSHRLLRLETPMMNGDDVKETQRQLRDKGFNPGSIDGWYGQNTESAVKDFQRAANITVDGIVGNQTRQSLRDFTPSKTWSLPNTVLRNGSRGQSVTQVQKALNELNFRVGAEDGIYGNRTQDGVRRFQSVHIPRGVDGVYGSNTRAKMLELLNK